MKNQTPRSILREMIRNTRPTTYLLRRLLT